MWKCLVCHEHIISQELTFQKAIRNMGLPVRIEDENKTVFCIESLGEKERD